MIERFDELIQDLGRLLDLPLHPDKNRICSLNINGKIHVQLEFDRPKNRLLIASFIGEVAAGKFRENALREALKFNAPFPRVGTFAFSQRNNQMALFDHLPIEGLDVKKLVSFMGEFVDRAMVWKEALQSGNLPTISPVKSSGMFGLKP
jgi:hypothetical protein